jgi:hypothetical protein
MRSVSVCIVLCNSQTRLTKIPTSNIDGTLRQQFSVMCVKSKGLLVIAKISLRQRII